MKLTWLSLSLVVLGVGCASWAHQKIVGHVVAIQVDNTTGKKTFIVQPLPRANEKPEPFYVEDVWSVGDGGYRQVEIGDLIEVDLRTSGATWIPTPPPADILQKGRQPRIDLGDRPQRRI